MSKRGTHSICSTNCIAAVVVSKSIHSGIVTANPASAPISAIQRACAASRSSRITSVARPATMGTKMASERYGIARALSDDPPRQQREHADDHGEGVLVDVARLQAPQHRRQEADQPRRAVDEEAVDD